MHRPLTSMFSRWLLCLWGQFVGTVCGDLLSPCVCSIGRVARTRAGCTLRFRDRDVSREASCMGVPSACLSSCPDQGAKGGRPLRSRVRLFGFQRVSSWPGRGRDGQRRPWGNRCTSVDPTHESGGAHQRAERASGQPKGPLEACAIGDHEGFDEVGPGDRQAGGNVAADGVAD